MNQDYMMQRPSAPADIPRTSGAELVKEALTGENLLAKGDVEGHEFHGNQYSGGGGADRAATIQRNAEAAHAAGRDAKAATDTANRTGKPTDHRIAASKNMGASKSFRQSMMDHAEAGDRKTATEMSRMSAHHWDKAQEHNNRANR